MKTSSSWLHKRKQFIHYFLQIANDLSVISLPLTFIIFFLLCSLDDDCLIMLELFKAKEKWVNN